MRRVKPDPVEADTAVQPSRIHGNGLFATRVFRPGQFIGSYTGEIASTIQDEAFDYLDAPVKRVGARNGIAPQSHILEAAFLPNVNDILAAANSIL